MPRLSILAVRASLLYLLAGFSLGAILLAHKGVPFAPWAWRFLPGHIDLLLFGFVIQLAMGIGYWILPRYPGSAAPRGRAWPVWAAVGLITAGVLLALAAGWFNLPAGWSLAARLLEGAAAALFAAHAWGRVRPFLVGKAKPS